MPPFPAPPPSPVCRLLLQEEATPMNLFSIALGLAAGVLFVFAKTNKEDAAASAQQQQPGGPGGGGGGGAGSGGSGGSGSAGEGEGSIEAPLPEKGGTG